MKTLEVALQLYSVREEMAQDMEQTLKAVKEMGYNTVEFAGYYGKTAEEIKKLLDRYQLKCLSAHQDYSVFLENPNDSIAFLQTLGAQYVAIPWMDQEKQKGSAEFHQTIADITAVGASLQSVGITLLYHNHEFEFLTYEGKFLLDWLYESVPADLLQTEIDTCWVTYSGNNPIEYIRKYRERSPIVHLKDYSIEGTVTGPVYGLIGKSSQRPQESGNFLFQPLGRGVVDISGIIRACQEANTHTVVVEQDESEDRPALESAAISRKYLKSLGI